jgi:hypothetical protein
MTPIASQPSLSPNYNVENAIANGASGLPQGVDLTGNALIEYCSLRLGNIDGQVSQLMNQQNAINSEQTGIQTLQNEVSELQSEVNSSTGSIGSNPAACQKLEQDIENLVTQIEQTDPGCSQLGALKQLHDTVMATGSGPYTDSSGATHGYYGSDTSNSAPGAIPAGTTVPAGVPNPSTGADNNLDSGELQDFASSLSGMSNALNSSGTMNMIQIQSLMSDRTTAIQLSTSTLQSLDDGNQKIVDNIGH